jgi:CHAT domain-containing protein/TPR repeat protein
VRFKRYQSQSVLGLFLLTVLVFFDRSPGFSTIASNDADAVRGLVGSLFESYQQKNLDRLVSHWSDRSPFVAENTKILQEEFAAYEKIAVNGFEIRKMQIEGDMASLRVAADLAITRAKMVKPTEQAEKKNKTIELVNEGGSWKLWKFIASEEELAAKIISAKTVDEWKVLMEKESELVNSDLAAALIRQNYPPPSSQVNYQSTLAINQLAWKLAEQSGNRLVMATALMNAGHIYGWIGTPEQSPAMALEYFRKSLNIGRELGFKDIVARSLILSAVMYGYQSEFTLSTEYNQEGLKLAEELGDLMLTTRAMNSLAICYRENGNYAKSMEMAMKCLKIHESQLNSEPNWDLYSKALQNIGLTFMYQHNVEQALAYFQKALEVAEKGIRLGDTKAKTSKENVLALIGKAHLKDGNPSLAMDYFQKNQKLLNEIWDIIIVPKDTILSINKRNIGDVFAAENKPLQAIAYYQDALQLAEKSRDKDGISTALLGLGEMYFSQGDYHEALAFAERAVKVAEESSQSLHIYRALEISAKAYQKLGRPEAAHQVLVRTIDIIEQLREHSASSEIDRQRFFEAAVTPYQTMIDLQVDQERFAEAFSYAQRAKGRSLQEFLQIGRVNIDKSVSPAEREREQQLSRKIVSINRQVIGEKLKSKSDEKLLAEFEAQLKNARLEFESFQTRLYATHSELKVQRGDIRSITFNDVAVLIPESKTGLMDFIVTDDNVHLFVLTKDATSQPTLNTYTVEIDRKSLAEKVDRFRRRMENRDYDFQALSQELYNLLLKPAQKQLQNKTNLIISPDKVLWDLPFQVLLSPENRYLIEDAAISYAPSLSVLREMQLESKKKPASAKASLLALGNPELGKQSIETAKFVKMDADLQPLPEAGRQVEKLGRIYGKTLSKVYTGSAAREKLVKDQSARYRILHLATHGILNDVSPMYSHVLLSQTPGKSDEDGLLEAWEMMNLDLNADLVVLSACETARGRVRAGEGVIGMTWALFVAGCPRTVVSQWKVEASSTTALMVEFHKKFKQRYGGPQPAVSTAEAMRQAALKVRRNPEYAHPFYWGGFVVVGDGN